MSNFKLRSDGMLRLCHVACVAACASLIGCAAPDGGSDDAADAEARIIRQMDRPLRPAEQGAESRVFAGNLAQGSLSASGRWQARAEIGHARLRCASYGLGIRFGAGNADCSQVDWTTSTDWAADRRQCNSATLIHRSDGRLDLPPEELRALSCVRIAIRCRGACG